MPTPTPPSQTLMSNSAPRSSRIVGILGGMGPQSTVDFYDKLVAHTPATADQEHVRVVIWADPSVPSRQAAILSHGTDPSPWLRAGIERLVSAGAEILVVPCNTVHHFLPGLIPDSVEFLSILDTTTDALEHRPAGAIGLLATNAALASGLFQTALESAGREVVLPSPSDQTQLTAIVEQVKGGTADTRTHARLSRILADLATRGATTTIAGCTELSALLSAHPNKNGYDVLDPSIELALVTIRQAYSHPKPRTNDHPSRAST